MRELSSSGQQAINDIAQRTGFSTGAVLSMLDAVLSGHGGMAQFNHPEFGGHGQWMRGGMTMVSDMFNHHLKGRVDGLCSELSNLIASQPELVRTGSFQSQSQGGQGAHGQQQQNRHGEQGHSPSPTGGGQQASASLFVPGTSHDWWPADLRSPSSTGAQHGVRYAYFAQAHRLAIDLGGRVTVYDTLDHQIGGFSQQQSGQGSVSFTSQHGLVDVASLPVVSGEGAQRSAPGRTPQGAPAAAQNAAGPADIVGTIEKLAALQAKGFISAEEFAAKKAELLGRL